MGRRLGGRKIGDLDKEREVMNDGLARPNGWDRPIRPGGGCLLMLMALPTCLLILSVVVTALLIG